jgi:hypothetical protein
MKTNLIKRRVGLLWGTLVMACACTAVYGVVFTSSPLSLYNVFPRDTQGENGIWLQRRIGSTYLNLTNVEPYTWKYPPQHYGLPIIQKSSTPGQIIAEPYAIQGFDTNDAIIRVRNDGAGAIVRVTGSAGQTSGSVRWYIYKGAANWDSPLWQSTSPASFDLTVVLNAGEEIFFGVDAGINDVNDHSYWQDITFRIGGLMITNTPISLLDIFPRTTQGENGVYVQRLLLSSGTYSNLTWYADYSWYTPEHSMHYNLPLVVRASDHIKAEPYADSTAEDAVIKIVFANSAPAVKITGIARSLSWPGDVTYRIYKGATNWSNPLWQVSGPEGGSFSIITSCNAGDELFFAVNANGSDVDDHAAWQDVTLQGYMSGTEAEIYTAVELTWETEAGKSYQVLYRTNLESQTWLPLGDPVPGTGNPVSVFDSTRTNATKFYKIVSP